MVQPPKQLQRQHMKTVRNSLSREELLHKSQRICRRLNELKEVSCAESVFVYVSYKSEVHTHQLLQDWLAAGKTVVVPKTVDSTHMEAHQVCSWDQLTPDRLGILSPVGTTTYGAPLELCIAPGLAFTERGDRLGYGRGHYDRFLSARPPMTVIALAFDLQIVDAIATEPTDRRVDLIVTESRVIVTAHAHANSASSLDN